MFNHCIDGSLESNYSFGLIVPKENWDNVAYYRLFATIVRVGYKT